jgi:radical SAM protein with 4Fe4S-binding SPASM domain
MKISPFLKMNQEYKRVDVKTGFICNNNCLFCVQADNKCKGNRSFEEIKKDLIESKKRCSGVVLTGGEVTIRSDFFEIVKLAKELDYETIQIQTNGRMFSSLDFCKKTIEAGATEFSPALHGYCAEQHDFLTNSSGSFNQTVKGIKNLKSLGAYVLTNTVIVKSNYRDIPKIAKLLIKLDVDQFQFAFVHPMGNAWKNFDNIVPCMSLTTPYIHKGLQIGINAGKKVMTEAIPYCLMGSYEDYAAEKIIPETEIRGKEFQNTNSFTRQRKEEGKAKFPQCKQCEYDSLCEGPWKEYSEKKGNEEFEVIKEKINTIK